MNSQRGQGGVEGLSSSRGGNFAGQQVSSSEKIRLGVRTVVRKCRGKGVATAERS